MRLICYGTCNYCVAWWESEIAQYTHSEYVSLRYYRFSCTCRTYTAALNCSMSTVVSGSASDSCNTIIPGVSIFNISADASVLWRRSWQKD